MNKIMTISCVILACNVMTSYAQNDHTKDKNQPTQSTQSVPANPHDPKAPTMAELQNPSDSQLSQANIDLIAKNSELQGRIDELTTEVNVLVNERSGQLFLYGALSVFVAFLSGFGLAWFIFNANKNSGW